MSAELLLARLERVRKTGPDRWIASCPTRADKHPSLSIRELPDGRVLIHDFGGDSAIDILNAVGLDMTALFPEKMPLGMLNHHKVERRPFNAHDALRCLAFEVVLLGIVANDLASGKPLPDVDRQRLRIAASRIAQAEELCNA